MTSPFVLALKAAIGAPVVASTAATRACVLPPTVPNVPPRYTVCPFTAIVCTVLFAFGSHGRSAPVARLIAAAWLRATSPVPAGSPEGRTEVNSPPRYAVVPLTTTVSTRPFVCHDAPTGIDPGAAASAPAASTSAASTAMTAAPARIRTTLPPAHRVSPTAPNVRALRRRDNRGQPMPPL